MEVNKETIRYILRFSFYKDENVSRVPVIVNGVYGANTVTANFTQFWFHRFRGGIFHVKGAPQTGRPVVKYIDKIKEMIDVGSHITAEVRPQNSF